ncbi:MAG TPA: DUF6766 family protein [Verrucomicrobiae bacterium]|nr:DUF6766 family protein [Verrucomicrobiae bacterium]
MKKRPFKISDYSLSLVLAVLFLVSWFLQGFFEWKEFAADQAAHGEAVKTAEYLARFLSSTFENWQSEFLQLFSMVILTSFLIHKGSPQSKDSSEKMERAIARIESKVDAIMDDREKRAA